MRSRVSEAENAPLGKNCIPRGRIIALAAATVDRVRENVFTYDELASGDWCLNTPRLIADDTQTTVWRWDNTEPFGAGACNPDPDGDNVEFEFNLRFPGQYFDRETNQHYNYFRDYDPAIGRYVQSDPIGLLGGLSTYLYGKGAPLRFTDPRGTSSTVIPLAILATIGVAISVSPQGRQAAQQAARSLSVIASSAMNMSCRALCHLRFEASEVVCWAQYGDARLEEYLACRQAALAVLKACLSSCDVCPN